MGVYMLDVPSIGVYDLPAVLLVTGTVRPATTGCAKKLGHY